MTVRWAYTPPAINGIVAVAAAKVAAETAAAEVLLTAARPLAPILSGDLRGSGTVGHDGDGATVTFTAVAPDGYDYAGIQHEREDYAHPRGGQAKYLEQPMHTAHEGMHAAIEAVIGTLL